MLSEASRYDVFFFFFFKVDSSATRENNVHVHLGDFKFNNSIQHIFIGYLFLPGAGDVIVKKTDMVSVLMKLQG